MKTKEELPECPVATTVQLIGSKWKLLILRNLLVRPWRFNELRKGLDGISQKVLTDSLRSMEEDGIITRTVYPEVPPRVEYALSELGESSRQRSTSSMLSLSSRLVSRSTEKSISSSSFLRISITCLSVAFIFDIVCFPFIFGIKKDIPTWRTSVCIYMILISWLKKTPVI